MINLKILLLIFVIMVVLDKGLTIANIYQVNKNFPQEMKGEYYKVEQNPVAKWFFEKYGLWGGSFVYGLVSLVMLFIGFFILSYFFNERIALWVAFIIYGFVIINNLYFLLKYSQVIS